MSGVIAETLIDNDHSKLYLKIWHLWYTQNLLLLLSAFLFSGCYFFAAFFPIFYLSLSLILNVTVFVALILDLVVVAVISFISISKGWDAWRKSQYEICSFIITGCGLIWIITSLIWRFPFYLRGPFEFGFDPMGRFSMVTLHGDDGTNDDGFFLFFWGGSIFLFLFLALQDRYSLVSRQVSNGRWLYGLTIFIGNLLITIYGVLNRVDQDFLISDMFGNLIFHSWVLMLLWKLVVTSLIGMRVAKKIYKDTQK